MERGGWLTDFLTDIQVQGVQRKAITSSILQLSNKVDKRRQLTCSQVYGFIVGGVQLRINRSIQAEGAFAMMKADMNFRRFLSRGTANVLVEIMLVAMAYNIQKLHCKIQSDRAGQHLFPVNNAA